MAVDLSDLVDVLKREVNAPGIDQLPGATTADYSGNLSDGFWEAYLDGFFQDYTESDGTVTNRVVGGPDMGRELQQLIVFYAGFRIVRNQLRDVKTTFKTSAGPVAYETQQAATVLTAILGDLTTKRNILLRRLSDLGVIKSFYYDAIQSRDESIAYGDIRFSNY